MFKKEEFTFNKNYTDSNLFLNWKKKKFQKFPK